MTRSEGTSSFVRDIADPEVADATRYGGKASGLSRMASVGVPVPPAFVIGADGFHRFRANGGTVGVEMMSEIRDGIRRLETATGRSFGDVDRPLLVSVRSGAAVSMPGMMDTVLNLGLTARSAFVMATSRGPRFALDTWLRFWRMFFDTVLGLDPSDLIEAVRHAEGQAQASPSLETFEALQSAVLSHGDAENEAISADPIDQLEVAISAVFRSWDSARAKAYRQHHGISDDLGTAVTVQAMVFGNADENSGSGVAFTRNPNTGEKALYGEYLVGRQGEDLVAGTQSPIDLSDPNGMNPELRTALTDIGVNLERLYHDVVDIEFTVEFGSTVYVAGSPGEADRRRGDSRRRRPGCGGPDRPGRGAVAHQRRANPEPFAAVFRRAATRRDPHPCAGPRLVAGARARRRDARFRSGGGRRRQGRRRDPSAAHHKS